jgi:hypothetical protein
MANLRSAPIIYNLETSGGKWLASRFARYAPGESVHGKHFIAGWVDTRASLEELEKGKIYYSLLGIENDSSYIQPVVTLL